MTALPYELDVNLGCKVLLAGLYFQTLKMFSSFYNSIIRYLMEYWMKLHKLKNTRKTGNPCRRKETKYRRNKSIK
jgi:hypothetical protein